MAAIGGRKEELQISGKKHSRRNFLKLLVGGAAAAAATAVGISKFSSENPLSDFDTAATIDTDSVPHVPELLPFDVEQKISRLLTLVRTAGSELENLPDIQEAWRLVHELTPIFLDAESLNQVYTQVNAGEQVLAAGEVAWIGGVTPLPGSQQEGAPPGWSAKNLATQTEKTDKQVDSNHSAEYDLRPGRGPKLAQLLEHRQKQRMLQNTTREASEKTVSSREPYLQTAEENGYPFSIFTAGLPENPFIQAKSEIPLEQQQEILLDASTPATNTSLEGVRRYWAGLNADSLEALMEGKLNTLYLAAVKSQEMTPALEQIYGAQLAPFMEHLVGAVPIENERTVISVQDPGSSSDAEPRAIRQMLLADLLGARTPDRIFADAGLEIRDQEGGTQFYGHSLTLEYNFPDRDVFVEFYGRDGLGQVYFRASDLPDPIVFSLTASGKDVSPVLLQAQLENLVQKLSWQVLLLPPFQAIGPRA